MSIECVMPPDGTSTGYRLEDGSMWVAGWVGEEKKPAIYYCSFPGNWVNPALHLLVAVFEKEQDRDLVLRLHKDLVVKVTKEEG